MARSISIHQRTLSTTSFRVATFLFPGFSEELGLVMVEAPEHREMHYGYTAKSRKGEEEGGKPSSQKLS